MVRNPAAAQLYTQSQALDRLIYFCHFEDACLSTITNQAAEASNESRPAMYLTWRCPMWNTISLQLRKAERLLAIACFRRFNCCRVGPN